MQTWVEDFFSKTESFAQSHPIRSKVKYNSNVCFFTLLLHTVKFNAIAISIPCCDTDEVEQIADIPHYNTTKARLSFHLIPFYYNDAKLRNVEWILQSEAITTMFVHM